MFSRFLEGKFKMGYSAYTLHIEMMSQMITLYQPWGRLLPLVFLIVVFFLQHSLCHGEVFDLLFHPSTKMWQMSFRARQTLICTVYILFAYFW